MILRMMKLLKKFYNINIYMLKLVNNSITFQVIINSLHEAFDELNINHEVVNNYDRNDYDNVYLICTTHETNDLPVHYISYNFEQLTTNKDFGDNYYERLKNAIIIFDYSLENINFLKNKGIDAHFLPFGYSKSFEYDNIQSKNIDFVFTGSMNDKRYSKMKDIIKLYDNNSDKIFIGTDCWGCNLFRTYANSKIGLNLHYYNGNTILEVTRINLLIANKVLVISERSNDLWYDSKYENIVNFISDNVPIDEYYLNVLNDYNLSNEVERRYNEFKNNHKFVDYIKNVIFIITQMKHY